MGDTMYDLAIFTPEVAKALMARGFELVAQTDKAWYFRDSVLLRDAVEELLEAFADKDL